MNIEKTSSDLGKTIEKRWFRRQPIEAAKMRLLMFPYAGGSARLFRSWNAWCGPTLECVAIELPGRGMHHHAIPIDSMDRMIDAVSDGILPLLDRPFAVLGYSVGALIAYELVRSLFKRGQGIAQHLFVGGMCAPSLVRVKQPLYVLGDKEFAEAIRALKGTPPEVLEQPGLFQIFMPALRADFRLGETYSYTQGPPLPIPITVFGGIHDEAAPSSYLHYWKRHTSRSCTIRLFEGDHFFIRQQEHVMAAMVTRALDEAGPATESRARWFEHSSKPSPAPNLI